MRLINFNQNGKIVAGVLEERGAIDLSVIAPELNDTTKILAGGQSAITYINNLLQSKLPANACIDPASIHYCQPIREPGKIICVGLNYLDHAKETGRDLPTYPVFFSRFRSSLAAHNQPIYLPACSTKFDFEGELAIIIGKQAKNISEQDAHSVIGGYSIFNDGTIRDYQVKSSQWLIGKNFDLSGAFGPYIVTPDAVPTYAQDLRITTKVNGNIMQDGNTSNMIFNVAQLIATITEAITLEPGDVIATGTPSGVGFARTPPVYLKENDLCEIEIEAIGTLINRVKKDNAC